MAPFNPGPSLVVTSGTGPARQIPIPFTGIVLGRDARLGPPFSTDEFVSRNHVWVRRHGDGVEVTDLGSANGTYVNGTRVRAPTRIQDSDMLRIGRIQLKLTWPEQLDQAMATRERPIPHGELPTAQRPGRWLGRGTRSVREISLPG